MTDLELLHLRGALKLGIKRSSPYMHMYGSPRGVKILRRLIADGFSCSEKEVAIRFDSIRLMSSLLELLLWTGDSVISDSPFSDQLLGELSGLNLSLIITDFMAMLPSEIEKLITAKKPRIVYCKYGYLSSESRLIIEWLAKLANRLNFWLIEDSSQISVHGLRNFLPSFSLVKSAPWTVHLGGCGELSRLPIREFRYIVASDDVMNDLLRSFVGFPTFHMQATAYEYFIANKVFSQNPPITQGLGNVHEY
jgi:hypothetical protein